MCAHTITNGSLVCQRTDSHDENRVGGHCYVAAHKPDAHDDAEAAK